MTKEKITIVGSGLVGSLLAIFLAKRGYQVEAFERRPDMRKSNIDAGRSINLALSTRGIYALNQVGLQDDIMKMTIPMRGRMVHPVDGELYFQRYGRLDNEAINSISRPGLNQKLMDEAESLGVKFYFAQRCLGIDLKNGAIALRDEVTGKERVHPVDVVIGSDGSASAIRNDMQKTGRFNYSQAYLEHGYKELTIPPAENNGFRLDETHALHIWPRGSYMLIALPNLDGSFTVTLFFPHQGELSFETINNRNDVQKFFTSAFPDAIALMPTLYEDYFANPTGNLVTVRCEPWHIDGKVCLMGDAAHAVVPFFGQGMNCAFEDCTVLDACIEQANGDWREIFTLFNATRNPDANAIADMALENYYEMRDHVADPKFLLKKEVEFALENKFPDRFIPRYTMVSFRRIPYAVTQQRGRIQEEILRVICSDINTVEKLNWPQAESLIHEKLSPV